MRWAQQAYSLMQGRAHLAEATQPSADRAVFIRAVTRADAQKPRLHRRPWVAILAWVTAASVAAALASAAVASAAPHSSTKVLRFHGVRLVVPSAWPVFRLGNHSKACVRFNRHAVYLGTPGSEESCPVHSVGRTEAILLAPEPIGAELSQHTRSVLAPTSTPAAAVGGGSMVTLIDKSKNVVITATWNRHPRTIARALGLRSLRKAILATNGQPPLRPDGIRRGRSAGRTTSSASPAIPGSVYNGLGFDTCTTQPAATMSAWGAASPYAAVGIYIGGANAACTGGNLTASWVSAESAAGWHLFPIYVGLQAPGSGCTSCASISSTPSSQPATEGIAAAQDAVAQAQALGIGTGNPIYFDMENYTRTTTATTAVLAFLQAWTQQLHASGYLSGVYSSASSGISDLVAAQGSSYIEPDDIWIAHWDGLQTTADYYVPSTDWANHQRLRQFQGGHYESYGGVQVNIDSDYLDAATAAYGNAGPSLKIQPQANGTVNLTPRWAGQPGVSSFQILGGSSASALTTLATVSASSRVPLVVHGVYAYYEVQALDSGGAVLASSNAIQAPSSVAVYGNSAFVGTSGPVGIPVACPNASTCRVRTSIYEGKKRLTQSRVEAVSSHGGVALVPLTKADHAIVALAKGRRLPVTITVVNSTGQKATRLLSLIPYTRSGRAPIERTGSSSALRILGKTTFVSNSWVGGVLALCTGPTPCLTTTRVTRGGAALSIARTQTLGPGEVGYLTYTLTTRAHRLLMRSKGNQLGARVTVTSGAVSSTTPSSTGGASTAAIGSPAMALVALISYR